MATKRNTDQEQDEDENRAAARRNDAPVGNDAPDSAQAAERRLQELASQLEEIQARYLRLAADFENYKKRARQEQLDTVQYAAASLAERLLPVMDDAKRALEHAPEGADEGWLRGVRLTFQHLEEALASAGVQPIETVGRPFDPKLHEAIGSEESAEYPEDTVLVELRNGYRMGDRVLRPALVKVSRRPAEDS
jgi:molecular chaperone GrpE